MMSWQSKNEVKIGEIGERIVKDILINQGYVTYTAKGIDSAHPFDILAVKNKEEMMIVEVKTKRCREEYPDTGIDRRNYFVYKEISEKHNLPVFVYFVDFHLKEVYGNYLDILGEERVVYPRDLDYPRFEGGIAYFPLEVMQHIRDLTDSEIKEILKYT